MVKINWDPEIRVAMEHVRGESEGLIVRGC